MNAINTHEYKEAVNKDQSFVVTGQGTFLWGLITWPKGYYHEELTHLHYCSRCGQRELTEIHGHYKVDRA